MDWIDTYSVNSQPGSQLTITGEIPYEYLQKFRSKAVSRIGSNLKIDGFRPGHIPEKVIIEKVGEMTILNDMAEMALSKIYPEILSKHKIDAIGQPQISVTKLATNNPFGFTITTAVMPEVKLPDYKKIAEEINKERKETVVSDEELDAQIKEIMKQKLEYEKSLKKSQSSLDSNEVTELPTPDTIDKKDDELPELTDEYVKSLGSENQFLSVEDFKNKLRKHLLIEKTNNEQSKHRAKITDQIMDKCEVETPEVLVQFELEQIFGQMQDDLKRANLSMDDYLSHAKKTKDDLIKEWRPLAIKRATLQLILNQIAQTDNIEPEESLVNRNVESIMKEHKDADPEKIKTYVHSVLRNEEVMRKLESL